MTNLFYRLSSVRSFATLFSMRARLSEERESAMYHKRSILVVLALVAFVSMGAFLFPQAGHAQECIWDCDLGSDFNFNPAENSPGFSIAYCFDQGCVAGLGIFSGVIPNASVKQCPSKTDSGVEKCLTDLNIDFNSAQCPVNVMITGNVVAVLKDANGNIKPGSAAEASLFVVLKGVTCGSGSPPSNLSRIVSVQYLPANVFSVDSKINIKAKPTQSALASPNWAGSGCTTNNKGILTADCSFPLGIDQSTSNSQLRRKFPANGSFAERQVYTGIGVGRFVGLRMCKGSANKPPSSIVCSTSGNAGGFDADAAFNFDGNWSGAGNKTFNPKSGTGPFDIITEAFDDIVLTDPSHPVMARANGGTPITATSCSPQPSQGRIRCNFPARDLLPNGCTTGQPVNVVVSGNVFSPEANREVKFLSTDSPTCNNGK